MQLAGQFLEPRKSQSKANGRIEYALVWGGTHLVDVGTVDAKSARVRSAFSLVGLAPKRVVQGVVSCTSATGEVALDATERSVTSHGMLQLVLRPATGRRVDLARFGETLDTKFMALLVLFSSAGVAFERLAAWMEVPTRVFDQNELKNRVAYTPRAIPPEKKRVATKTAGSLTSPPSAAKTRGQPRTKLLAKDVGLLALLRAGAGGGVFGGPGVNPDLLAGLDALKPGGGLGDQAGVGGLASRGGKPGGPPGTIGIGGIGAGHSVTCDDTGCAGSLNLGGNGYRGTRVVREEPKIAQGGLTADEVNRVVRRHFNEIRFCYERALDRDPNLEGKVSVAFEIAPTGEVVRSDVAESALADPGVGACMTQKILLWRFPVPRGGGVVQVRYPFIFRRN